MDNHQFPLLSKINDPKKLRSLPLAKLAPLAEELRKFILESVAETGGHLSSNLGTIELTIALHYIFNTPEDRIVWDVGHQTYAHKIVTGRSEQMSKLRMKGGPSGFPRRDESEYDSFGVGHSSTSISAALGMAEASRLTGDKRLVVAVIGDGAMSGGMAFEALNNAGISHSNMLVILNDNEMSISPAVGALHEYLVKLLSSKMYRAVWRAGAKLLGKDSTLIELARKAEEHTKGMITPGTLFEELGFYYMGPINGHDLPLLLGTLTSIQTNMKENTENPDKIIRPQLLHIVTKKGQGYKLAEKNPILYHGVAKFNSKNGLGEIKSKVKTKAIPQYSEVFGNWICDMAAVDKKLVGITPAMREGSGLTGFAKKFPDRYFDVGIAEQHAITFAAGLACEKLKPVVAIYSTFLQRGYDQVIHDVALQNLSVLFAIDRAGLVGADGATHAGSFDISFLQCLPNIILMAASNENELRQMLTTGYYYQGPAAVRYPRGKGLGVKIASKLTALPIGKAEKILSGEKIAILALGSMVNQAKPVAKEMEAALYNMRFIKPLDYELIKRLAKKYQYLVTIEENSIIGGVGSEIARYINSNKFTCKILQLGLPDKYIEHADSNEQFNISGLSMDEIKKRILTFIDK